MKIIYSLAVIAFLTVWPIAGGGESCVECHTDGSIMSSLVEMPAKRTNGSPGAIGPAGIPALIKPDVYYMRYYVDKSLTDKDPHFGRGCVSCHKGDGKEADKDKAHKGFVKRPSADLKTCGGCHEDITGNYQNSLHYTVSGFTTKVSMRFSAKEEAVFKMEIFGKSCRSCHAACGDCHVSSPSIDGIRSGFLKGHAFVKRDEGKTCGICHGGRVYAEYTGRYGAGADVHYQKGMMCTNCHKKGRLHGEGGMYAGKDSPRGSPKCKDCHKAGSEKRPVAKLAHSKHEGRVSCYGCHVRGEYRNCSGCHEGKASSSRAGLILGADPENKRLLTTLRQIPVSRDTFSKAGIKMERFDDVTDYRAAPVHNIQRVTARTRSCDICHVNKKDLLTKGSLIKNGSKANEGLIFRMPPLEIN
ncbi:MAG TPA: multiheme c-type cytochrome [Syntrophorhabdaceae bacterium]|nr:multiheme c-type cytochrome [Syntrophorhabdaceae bacterium]